MESKLKTAEWIVKNYALDKSYQRNHAVQDWLYDAKILLIDEANRLRDLSLYGKEPERFYKDEPF